MKLTNEDEIKRRIYINSIKALKKIGYIIICFFLIFIDKNIYYSAMGEVTQSQFNKELIWSALVLAVMFIVFLSTKRFYNYKSKIYFWIGLGTCVFGCGMLMIIILRKLKFGY